MPSEDLSAEHAMTLYMVGPPPIARRIARLRTTTKVPRRMSSSSAPADLAAVAAQQLHRAVLLEALDRRAAAIPARSAGS